MPSQGQNVLLPFLEFLFALLMPILFICVVAIVAAVAVFLWKNREYKNGMYYQITKNSLLSVLVDKGKMGEYLTYQRLRAFEAWGAKFLFNIYIPKATGGTTEIDLLMICPKGVFVFESKNYSGWIFGSETQKNWYQTLPKGRGQSHKEAFYNPVLQNRSHIKHLKAMLGEQLPVHSVIVFSERCTLKNIQLQSRDVCVVNRQYVYSAVSAICSQMPDVWLTEFDIANLFAILYPYAQANAFIKAQHISAIHNYVPPQAQTGPVIQTSVPAPHFGAVQPGAVPNQRMGAAAPGQEVYHPPKCPKCSGELVLRTITVGTNAGSRFYGCSNYPYCKYFQQLKEQPAAPRKN